MDSLDLQRKRKAENKHKEKKDYTWEIFFGLAIPFVIVMMVWATIAYEKDEEACRDIGGEYKVVD